MYSCYDIKGDNNMSMNNSNKLSVRDLDLFYGDNVFSYKKAPYYS